MTMDTIRRFKPLLDIMGNPEYYIKSDPVLGENTSGLVKSKVNPEF